MVKVRLLLCIFLLSTLERLRSDSELENLCDLSVRGLEELIDYQEYPVKAAEIATKNRRSLGVGFIGLAHYLAKLGYNYDSQEPGMQFMDSLNPSNTIFSKHPMRLQGEGSMWIF